MLFPDDDAPFPIFSDLLSFHEIDASHPVKTIGGVAAAVLVLDVAGTGRRCGMQPPLGVVGAGLRSENAAASFYPARRHHTRLTAQTAASHGGGGCRRRRWLQAQRFAQLVLLFQLERFVDVQHPLASVGGTVFERRQRAIRSLVLAEPEPTSFNRVTQINNIEIQFQHIYSIEPADAVTHGREST